MVKRRMMAKGWGNTRGAWDAMPMGGKVSVGTLVSIAAN
jgi:hypothetical protein